MSIDFQIATDDGRMIETIPGTPSFNVSNMNASTLLAAVGVDLAPHYCGTITPEDFSAAYERFLSACEQGRGAEFERSATDSGGPGTGFCRVISCGADLSYVLDRLNTLDRMAGVARASCAVLTWC